MINHWFSLLSSAVSRPQAQSLFLSLCSSLPMFGVSLFAAYVRSSFTDHWSLITHHWTLITDYQSSITDHWSSATLYWILIYVHNCIYLFSSFFLYLLMSYLLIYLEETFTWISHLSFLFLMFILLQSHDSLQGENQTEYFLGPTPVGVVIYKNKVLVGKYFW